MLYSTHIMTIIYFNESLFTAPLDGKLYEGRSSMCCVAMPTIVASIERGEINHR